MVTPNTPAELLQRIYVLPEAVAPSVCSLYIGLANELGWTPSNIKALNPEYDRRQSRNVSIDMNMLLSAAKTVLPERLDGMILRTLVKQRTICMRYDTGQYFGPHTDGAYTEADGAISKFTLILYLNDDYIGGDTVFLDASRKITPTTGTLLAFSPDLRHMSEPVLSGTKYILRSEALYGPPLRPAHPYV